MRKTVHHLKKTRDLQWYKNSIQRKIKKIIQMGQILSQEITHRLMRIVEIIHGQEFIVFSMRERKKTRILLVDERT